VAIGQLHRRQQITCPVNPCRVAGGGLRDCFGRWAALMAHLVVRHLREVLFLWSEMGGVLG
jgi:hypothetical protein